MYHAIDADSVADGVAERARPHPFTFTGSSGVGLELVHQDRYWALLELLRRADLECWRCR